MEWLDSHGEIGRLREAIRLYYESPLLRLRLDTRSGGAQWPPIKPIQLDEVKERAANASTHAALIVAQDIRQAPRVGLWAANAAALGLASKTGGIPLAYPVPIAVRYADEPFPRNGEIAVARHTYVPYSVDSRGLGYMTTVGMEQFGLPNLQLRDVSPSWFSPLLEILMAIAQQLVTRSMAVPLGAGNDASDQEFTLGAEMLILTSDVAAAFGKPEREVFHNAKQRTKVRLELQRAGGPHSDMMLTVLPPNNVRAKTNVWLSELIADLFGTENTVRMAQTGDTNVAAAHARAMAEFPYYCDRFVAGLAVGERLLVKYGFPNQDAEPEFMWITVLSIRAGTLFGTLSNNPQIRRDLRSGQEVSVPVSDVYDFTFTTPAGSNLGNYTGKAIMGVPLDSEL